MKRTKFKVNLGVVDYTISLDEQYKIEYIQNGSKPPYYRESAFKKNKISENAKILKDIFKYMIVFDTEDFKILYRKLKKNDIEMLKYAQEAIAELRETCSCLKEIE